jgi:hypothetical protein
MPKMKYPASYSKAGSSYDDTVTSNRKDYYEPFSGYTNSVKDQATYWNMIKTPKGVIPQTFMSTTLPMANDVGRKKGKK